MKTGIPVSRFSYNNNVKSNDYGKEYLHLAKNSTELENHEKKINYHTACGILKTAKR